jgi:hypothetical protein
MLTLFPTPATESPKPEPNPVPRRLQYFPVAMLVAAAVLELVAWHRSALGHAVADPLPAKFSPGLPAPLPNPAAAPQPALPPEAKPLSRRELEKIHAAKARMLETYTNPQYGISLSYPRTYSLAEAEAITDDPNPLLQQRADGSPSQQLVVRIELPDNLYPRTDFLAGYLSLSVNPALTADQCGQAIGSEEEGQRSSTDINGVSWQRLQSWGTIDGTRTAWREYSAYPSAICYEVELGVVTVNDGTLTPVNEERVFNRLETVLRTLKIKPADSAAP